MTVNFMPQQPIRPTASSGSVAPVNKVNPDISGVNFARIANKADDTYDPEMAKYAAAVDLARQKFSGKEDGNEKLFRQTIDDIYKNELNGTLNPDTDIRGNNAFTLAIRGLNEGYDDLLGVAGNMIDKPWDFVAGGIADNLMGKKTGDRVRNLMDGRDVGTALDIGADIALAATPFGMPALAAKSLVRQSDNIDEMVKGYDNVTLEDLTGAQRAARGGEAALNTALSMLPGVGRAGKVVKGATKKSMEESAERFGKKAAEIEGAKKTLTRDAFLEDRRLPLQEALDAATADVAEKKAASDAIKQAMSENGFSQELLDAGTAFRNAARERNAAQDALRDFNAKAQNPQFLADDYQAELKVLQDAIDENAKLQAQATKLANGSYLGRMMHNEAQAGRNLAASIRNIPSDIGRNAEISKELGKNLGIQNVDKLPRSNRGIRKLMREHPERFDIEVPRGSSIDDVISRGKQRQLAGTYGNIIREDLGRTNVGGALKRGMKNIGQSANPANYSPTVLEEDTLKAINKLKANEAIKGTSEERLKDIGKMVVSSLSGVGALGLQGGLAGMATGDYNNLQQGVLATFNDIERRPWRFLPGLFPVGAKQASMRMNPNLRGNLGSAMPFNAARASALGDYITTQTEPDTSKASNEEEIIRRLAALKAGE